MATTGALRRGGVAYAVVQSSSFVRSVTAGAASGTANSRRSVSGPTFVVTSRVVVRCRGARASPCPDEFALAEMHVRVRQERRTHCIHSHCAGVAVVSSSRDHAVVGVCHDDGRVRRELTQEACRVRAPLAS